jgi:streptomycin 6-kinase
MHDARALIDMGAEAVRRLARRGYSLDLSVLTVYYDLGRETSQRLATAARISRISVPVIAPWCRLLSLDGLLYYVDTGDPRAPQMAEVLSFLSARGVGGAA